MFSASPDPTMANQGEEVRQWIAGLYQRPPTPSLLRGCGMAYIEKRTGKNGTSYKVQIRRKGFPVITKSFTRKTDAEAWARQQEADLERGQLFPEREAMRRTVKDACIKYLAEHVQKMAHPKDRTRHINWWVERVGHLRLVDLRPDVINEHLQELSSQPSPNGGTLAPSTVRHYQVAITHLLHTARKWGWIKHVQTEQVIRPKISNERQRYLTDDELPRLLAAVQDHPDLQLLTLLALGTGARAGELLTLTWRQVDLKKRQITLTKTKNGDARTLPIPEAAYPLLKGRIRQLGVDLVFPSKRDPSRPTNVRNAWLKALKRADIEEFHFHDLRHSAASYLVQAGVSLVQVAALLGHRDLKMTRRYSHLEPKHLAALGTMLDQKIKGGAA